MRKTYKNKAEESFCQTIEALGMTPMKEGWPDFFCTNVDGICFLVEVKPNHKERLRDPQQTVMMKLAEYGIPCYRFDPETGELLPIQKITHQFKSKTPLS